MMSCGLIQGAGRSFGTVLLLVGSGVDGGIAVSVVT